VWRNRTNRENTVTTDHNIPGNPIDRKEAEREELAEYERKMVQTVAEAMWAVATSNNREVTGYRTDTYQNMEKVLNSVVKLTYDLTDAQVVMFRDILCELGPYDGYNQSPHMGTRSYVDYAIQNTLPKGWRKMSSSALEAFMGKMDHRVADDAIQEIEDELDRRDDEETDQDIPRDQLDYDHNAPLQY
jgi:hypothetical protein